MQEVFIPDSEFKAQVKARKAVVVDLDGHARWKVTEGDGTEYFLRPDSAKHA